MTVEFALSAGPLVAAVVTVTLLNVFDASPETAVAILALVALISGAAIGVFWEVPDEPAKLARSPGRALPRS